MCSDSCTHGCRRDSQTDLVGVGKAGSAKAPTGTAIISGAGWNLVEDRRTAIGAVNTVMP
jgi:hypothetical protein